MLYVVEVWIHRRRLIPGQEQDIRVEKLPQTTGNGNLMNGCDA